LCVLLIKHKLLPHCITRTLVVIIWLTKDPNVILKTKSMIYVEKLKQLRPYQAEMDSLFKELYDEFMKSDFVRRDKLPSCRGIYAFYENRNPIYVGRANNIRKRIQWHTRESSGSESASFAFNLAKREYANEVKINHKRKELMQIDRFVEIFRKHKLNLKNVEFRCVPVENDILQTMFEPYLAFKLKTYPINNTFENH